MNLSELLVRCDGLGLCSQLSEHLSDMLFDTLTFAIVSRLFGKVVALHH